MVTHARECDLTDSPELRSYEITTSNASLFFNCIDDLIGAKFHDIYVAKDKFNAQQKVPCATAIGFKADVLIVVNVIDL